MYIFGNKIITKPKSERGREKAPATTTTTKNTHMAHSLCYCFHSILPWHEWIHFCHLPPASIWHCYHKFPVPSGKKIILNCALCTLCECDRGNFEAHLLLSSPILLYLQIEKKKTQQILLCTQTRKCKKKTNQCIYLGHSRRLHSSYLSYYGIYNT